MSKSDDQYFIFCYYNEDTIILFNIKLSEHFTADDIATFLTVE